MKLSIYLIIVIVFFSVCQAAPYRRKIDDKTLTIRARRETRKGRRVYFYSRKNRKDVILRYGPTIIYANNAQLQETKNKIYLKGGFYSKYLDQEIIGNSVIYNPFNNFFDAKDVTVKSAKIVSQAENFSFYGERISLKKAKLGISQIKLDIEFGQLDLYPGWSVANHMVLKLFDKPFLYAPTVVIDNRRNTYPLPTPLPEFGNSYFRGDYWRENIHYYINEHAYGNIQFGRADEKGAGYGGQFNFRFSDYDQFTYINDNWQYDNTQEKISFEHSFLELPARRKKYFSFNEMLKYNEEIKELPANTIRIDQTKFEEINEEIIHREPELVFDGNFDLPWDQLKLHNKTSYALIDEITSQTNANKYQLLNEVTRPSTLPYFGNFTPGIGYDSIYYSARPFNWFRLYDFIKLERKWWIFGAKGIATDYLSEKGNSPFNFDQKFELADNVKTELFMRIFKSTIGRRTKYTIVDYKIFDIIYFLKLRRSSWSLNAEYSTRNEAWSASIQITLI